MIPDRLNFLSEFDNFYQTLVRDLKENKYNEVEFYLIIIAKVKAMVGGQEGGKRRFLKRRVWLKRKKKR